MVIPKANKMGFFFMGADYRAGTDDKSIAIGELGRKFRTRIGAEGRARRSLQMKQLPAFGAVEVRPLHPIKRE